MTDLCKFQKGSVAPGKAFLEATWKGQMREWKMSCQMRHRNKIVLRRIPLSCSEMRQRFPLRLAYSVSDRSFHSRSFSGMGEVLPECQMAKTLPFQKHSYVNLSENSEKKKTSVVIP